MKNKPKVKCMMMKALLGVLLFIVGIPLIINWLYMQDKGFQTVWDGADVLAFYGAALSVVGAIILGYCAYKQNQRILQIEEDREITENVSVIVLKSFKLKDEGILTDALPRLEQILVASTNGKSSGTGHLTLKFGCDLLHGVPLMIHIERLKLWITNTEKGSSSLSLQFDNESQEFSRIELLNDQISFNCTVLLPYKDMCQALAFLSDKRCSVRVDMDISLLNFKYVQSRWNCKGSFKYKFTKDDTCELMLREKLEIINEETSGCAWFGSKKLNISDVKVKN